MTTNVIVKIIFLALVSLAAICEAAGDVIFKQWSIDGRNLTFAAGMIVYFAAAAIWAVSLKYEFLSKAISVVTVLNLLVVVLVGVLYFKEDLSLINKIGIALGVLSVVLVEA